MKTDHRNLQSVIISIFLGGSLLIGLKPAFAGLGNVTDVTRHGDTLTLTSGTDREIIQVCRPDLIKIDYQPGGKTSPDTEVLGSTSWGQPPADIDTTADPITIKTSQLTLKITKSPCRLSLYNASNKLLLQEPVAGGFYPANGSSGSGVHLTYANADAQFYGIFGYGSYDPNSPNGMLSNAGGPIRSGTQGQCGAPFVWSNAGFGLLVDTVDGKFEIEKGSLKLSDCTKTNVECYLMVGPPATLVQRVIDVSGHTPMFPKWAMGFANTQWGSNENELLNVMATYRQKHEPIDAYIVDFDWKNWGKPGGEFQWNPVNYPDGASGKFARMIAVNGFHLVVINKPRFHVDQPLGKYITDKGWWFPEPVYQDYFDGAQVNDLDFRIPAARKWWSEKLMKDVFSTGVSGWWNDEGDGAGTYLGNLEFLCWGKGIYEAQRAISNQRVYQLNRDFFLGAQRYGYAMWSGDIHGDWETMAVQRDRMLQAVNLGERLWGMDTGGFNDDDGQPDNEQYARWMEFASFVPIFRVHGSQWKLRQPWLFGAKAEAAATRAMRLRYSLIPYIYSYERTGHEQGTGLVHPLVWDYPSDPKLFNDTAAWMFGDSMLVSPILTQGAKSHSIYLPRGTWIDYLRGNCYAGGKTIDYSVTPDSWRDLPLFVKPGSIIPTQPAMDYVGQKPVVESKVDVFPSTTASSFRYYDDDGTTYNYEKGVYFAQTISQQQKSGQVSLTVSKPLGSYRPALQSYLFAVHGIAAGALTSGGASLTRYTTASALSSAHREGWATGNDIYGKVTYVQVAARSAQRLILRGTVVLGKGHAPVAPTGVTATADDGQVTVMWADVFGAQSYNVYRSTLMGGPYTQTALGQSLTSYADMGLTNGTTYFYKVAAVGAFGESPKSVALSAMPFAVTKYEAENAVLTGGASVASDHVGYSGTGFTAGIAQPGASVAFKVTVGAAGKYRVGLRYANSVGGPDPNDCFLRTLTVSVNGKKIGKVSLMPFGDWDTWATESESLPLKIGPNTITYSFDNGDTGNVNLDYLTVSNAKPGNG